MKKNISLMINLLLASTLFWGVPLAYGEEQSSEEMISTVPAELPSYCHIQSPAMREDICPEHFQSLMTARSTPSISMVPVIMIRSALTQLMRSGV
jgi:hypothetical protein